MGALGPSLSLRELQAGARAGAAAAALVLAASSLAHFGLGARGLIGALLCTALVLAAAFDLEQRRIPNRIVLPATGGILVAQLVFFPGEALEWVGAALGAGLLLALPLLLRRDAIGMGDVKLAVLLGAGLGGQVLMALFIGSLAVAPLALWILARHGSEARGEAIPLGPALALGGIAALFLGDLPA